MKGRKIFTGIVLIMAAVALILWGAKVDIGLPHFTLWQMLAGAVCVYWIVRAVVFGEGIREKLRIFLPLAFLFLIFERNIASLAGAPDGDLISGWIVIGAAVIISIALDMMLPKKKIDNAVFESEFVEVADGTDTDGERSNSFGSKTYYLDASKPSHFLKNSFGELNVYFQNVESAAPEIRLNVKNSVGETTVHVPSGWRVENRVNNSLGDVSVKERAADGATRVVLTGSNSLGEINVV